jgi:hypothetical protein
VAVFDNTAVTRLCISLATKAPQLFTPVKHRGELLAAIRGTANVYTVWSSRDYVQLSDWLSKDEKAKFALGLAERGCRLPRQHPFCDPTQSFDVRQLTITACTGVTARIAWPTGSSAE